MILKAATGYLFARLSLALHNIHWRTAKAYRKENFFKKLRLKIKCEEPVTALRDLLFPILTVTHHIHY